MTRVKIRDLTVILLLVSNETRLTTANHNQILRCFDMTIVDAPALGRHHTAENFCAPCTGEKGVDRSVKPLLGWELLLVHTKCVTGLLLMMETSRRFDEHWEARVRQAGGSHDCALAVDDGYFLSAVCKGVLPDLLKYIVPILDFYSKTGSTFPIKSYLYFAYMVLTVLVRLLAALILFEERFEDSFSCFMRSLTRFDERLKSHSRCKF
ncbi:hypothetical protein QQ045_005619 [Rhodiola kirilowii]